MDALERMQSGALYDFSEPEIMQSIRRKYERLARFNRTSPFDDDYAEALAALVPHSHPTARIMPPFRCDHGHPIRLAEDVFVNFNCTFLDCGGIEIGARTLVGPDCKLYTAQHPTDFAERRQPVERGLSIRIGADCWLGGNVTVCPGVTVGDRVIVAAGSVVVHDLPDDVLAAGNPAVVKRKLR